MNPAALILPCVGWLTTGLLVATLHQSVDADTYPGLPTRSQNPLLQSYFIPAQPLVSDETWSLAHSLYITNTYQTDQNSAEQLLIDVEEDEAVITATVNATMHRHGYDRDVYETTVEYQDRDTLRNWTANDNAAWRNYANFARHYVGREIADRVYGSAGVAQALRPVESQTVRVSKRDPWQGSSKKLRPTLAWKFELPASDDNPAWAAGIDESSIYYDVEIYDAQRPVYRATQVPEPSHTVTAPLAACQTYRWTVRPVYRVGDEIKYGAWMRSGTEGNGNIGKQASEAPAYLYDFAQLEVKCGSK
mgnify:CR=1 FL=1